MGRSPKLLIFGIDGLAPSLLADAFAAGEAPHLASLATTSCGGSLRCTWPPHTATGWPTLFCGRLPGDHGLFQFWDCQDPDYRLHVVGREEAGVPGLWQALSAAGWSLGRVNLPMSHPGDDLPGYQITWPLVPTLRHVHPPGLAAELLAAGGHVQPDIACMYDGAADYPERAVGFVRARTRSLLHLLSNRPVDAVAVVYSELDRVCHHYWHAYDPDHPRHGEAEASESQVIPTLLAEIDAALGQVLAAAGDDCSVLVVSDHGFGPGHRGVRLHHLLAEGGFCRLADEAVAGGACDLPDRELERAGRLPALDWPRTTAYMPCPGSFAVNLNLAGRQRHGRVPPSERRATLDRVATFLLSQRDPQTGQVVFQDAVPGETAYAGPFARSAPDLLLVPASPTTMVLCDADGPTWGHPGQEGLHRLEGVWMWRSAEGSAGGEGFDLNAPPRAAEAVAGNLLDAFGLSAPEVPRHEADADAALRRAGLPLDAWSQAADQSSGQRCVAPRSLPAAEAAADHPPLDARDIERRLRHMGYL